MSDQPNNDQPKLSIEEELDVLEAVYKIGKEKGLDLLRPEQLRKLTEAGRIERSTGEVVEVVEGNSVKKDVDSKKKYPILKTMIEGLLQGIDDEYKNELDEIGWKDMDEADKFEVRDFLFKMKYGAFPDYFATKLTMRKS